MDWISLLVALGQAVALVVLKIERQTHRQVRFQRRIERDVEQFGRHFEAHFRIIRPHQDRLSVLVLADLEKRIVVRRLDEIAFRVDQEHPHRAAGYLAAENEGCAEGGFALVAAVRRSLDHVAHGLADQARNAEHRWHFHDVWVPVFGRLGMLFQHADNRLRGRQIARRQKRDQAFPGLGPGVHLAEGGNVVDACIRPGVGHEHEAPVEA